MLKFILYLMMLMVFISEWNLVQSGLFLLCVLLSIFSYHDFYLSGLGFGLGTDYLSYILILLSAWIMSLVISSSTKVNFFNIYPSSFLFVNLLLLAALFITFSSMDYLMFYISFEASLIPNFILILGWGYQPEGIQAGVYMLFYTLLASLPLLVSILYIYKINGSLSIGLM